MTREPLSGVADEQFGIRQNFYKNSNNDSYNPISRPKSKQLNELSIQLMQIVARRLWTSTELVISEQWFPHTSLSDRPGLTGTKSTAIGISQCNAARLMHKQALSNIALTRSALWATQSTKRLSQTSGRLENWHAHRPIESSFSTSLLPCRVCLDAA